MLTGSIKKVIFERSFGFITAHGGTDYFFHSTDCAVFDQLQIGDQVRFNAVENSPKGPRACGVELV